MTPVVCEVAVPGSSARSDCAILEFILKVTFRALSCSSYPPLPPFSTQTLPSLPEPQAHAHPWELPCSSARRACALPNLSSVVLEVVPSETSVGCHCTLSVLLKGSLMAELLLLSSPMETSAGSNPLHLLPVPETLPGVANAY